MRLFEGIGLGSLNGYVFIVLSTSFTDAGDCAKSTLNDMSAIRNKLQFFIFWVGN